MVTSKSCVFSDSMCSITSASRRARTSLSIGMGSLSLNRAAMCESARVTDTPVPFGTYQYEIYLRGLNGEKPELPTTYDELEAKAREKLSPKTFYYTAGGAGEGRTMRANRAAFDRWRIVPRMLGDISTRD